MPPYSTATEVKVLLGNLGGQRTDAQVNLAIESADDEINTKTNRVPPDDWKDTEHNYGIVKKLSRYIATREMAIGIKDFDIAPLTTEIDRLFHDLMEYGTSAATQDIVVSSEDETYALNPQGIIWSTRYNNLRKGSTSENDTNTINPDT